MCAINKKMVIQCIEVSGCSFVLHVLSLFLGVKHQIRTHLLHVLNTPILGDHKYSYLTEIKPQVQMYYTCTNTTVTIHRI